MTYRDERDAKIARLEAENADLRTRNDVQAREIDDLMTRLKLKHDPDEQVRRATASHELYVAEALARGRRLGADTSSLTLRVILLLLAIGATIPGTVVLALVREWLLR